MIVSKVMRVRLVLAVPCLVMLLSPMLWAQLYSGTVTGVISDPSGAVVPSAQVQLMDEQKGFVFTASSGVIRLPFKPRASRAKRGVASSSKSTTT
jgi:hypothetical protein